MVLLLHDQNLLKAFEYDGTSVDNFTKSTVDQATSLVDNSHYSLATDEQRERFPVRKYRDKILFCLETYQIIILVGKTLSSQSIPIPQYLYQFGWHIKGQIGVITSNQLSAINLAEAYAFEMDEVLGSNVRVAMQFIPETSNVFGIKFMAEEVLLREILNDPLLTQYSVIIIDNAHERKSITDTILGLLKKIIKKRVNLKIIIVSATTDGDYFKSFFNFKNIGLNPLSIILSVHNPSHEVIVFYKMYPCFNYVHAIVETVLKIHKNGSAGDILAFLTGQDDVFETSNLLMDYILCNDLKNITIIPMFGKLINNDQQKGFIGSSEGVRKVVIAANIADNSIIDGIAYVIDCGFIKLQWFNSVNFTNNIEVFPISKSTAQHRSKHSGMKTTAKVYRLYSEDSYLKLNDRTPPEIRRTELCSLVVYLKALGVNNLLRFDFPSPPPAKNMLAAFEVLFALDALDYKGKLMMPLGYFLAEVPFGPMFGKMLYMAGILGCSEEIISIISMLQVQSIFIKPKSIVAQHKARIEKRKFEVAEGDLITMLNVYTAFVYYGRTKEFCNNYFLSYYNLNRADKIREQLVLLVTKRFGIFLSSCKGNIELLGKCITAGFFPNTAYLHYSGEYRTIRGNYELSIHPLSLLHSMKKPNLIIYCELLQTTKMLVNNLTVVDEKWLTELASHYYFKKTFFN